MTAAKWPEVRLAEIAEVKLGRQRSPQHHNGTQMRPYVRAANVGWSGLILDDVKQMNFTDREMTVYRLQPGDLLLNEASGSAREVGKPAIWNGEIADCGFQNTLLRVRSLGPDPRYLLHFFRYQAESGRFATRSRGVGIYHLGREALASLPVFLPPLEDQRRIAEILDATNELRARRRESLALLDSLTESIFLDMFGDPVTNPMGWPEATVLGDVAEIVSGITKGRRLNGEAVRSVPYLAVANVQDGYLRLGSIKHIDVTSAEIAKFRLSDGDLLLTEGGDPDKLGRGTIWSGEIDECIHQNHIFRVRIRSADLVPLFVSRLVASRRGQRYFLRSAKQTTGIASVNKTQLAAFPLLIPPNSLQLEFVKRVNAKAGLESTLTVSNSELESLFASLQQRAFRGELTGADTV